MKLSKDFFSKIINFIKYNNAFTIGIILVFLTISGVFAASPEAREAFLSSQDSIRSVDNSYILSANLDNFDFGLRIITITEDTDNYYITYAYKTIYIKDYIWQDIEKQKTFDVSKEFLKDENKDLGLYAAEELGEVLDYELSYLKEVQTLEREKGLTQKIVTTQYAGLIGRFLSPTEKVFEGYQPVVPEEPEIVIVPQSEPVPQPEPTEAPIAIPSIDRESLRQMIQEIISQPQSNNFSGAVSQPTPLTGSGETTEQTNNEQNQTTNNSDQINSEPAQNSEEPAAGETGNEQTTSEPQPTNPSETQTQTESTPTPSPTSSESPTTPPAEQTSE